LGGRESGAKISRHIDIGEEHQPPNRTTEHHGGK